MAELFIPVGHDVGAIYEGDGSNLPASYDLGYADGTFSLSSDEYLVWRAAHGQVGKPGETRTFGQKEIEDLAKSNGAKDPHKAFAELNKVGAIITLEVNNPEAITAFAKTHLVYPITRGLGNISDMPWLCLIETYDSRTVVTTEIYYLWAFSVRSHSLWNACEEIAKQEGIQDPANNGMISYLKTPQEFVQEFLSALPELIAGECLYIDRSL